ncbi:type II toxin-antitoxin system Phd/YefM family antitoxin [Tianweitania sp.]|uniref:type II toxin-antitoxin system Phd/YefM family antitoxin n=1 Tax=Tianweitania sp. TaxID=2021634 RepID=UPI003A101FE7
MLDAKTSLSRLVQAVESGEEKEIVIARNGKPAAKLVPIDAGKRDRILGQYKDVIPAFTLEEWNESDADVAAMFGRSK